MKVFRVTVLTSIIAAGINAAEHQQYLGPGAGSWPGAAGINSESRPNVVFILTDDQDVHLSSLDYMPFVRKHLLEQGTYFSKHYCTTALCCPSRVTLWTGKAAHNTNITDVDPPYGGYPKFVTQGFNKNYLPVWLQKAGYNTYYTGKLFNVHTVDNYDSPYAAGFTESDFLLDPYTYNYLNSTFQHTGETPRSYEGQYSTDVLAQKAYSLLDHAVQAEEPFFLTLAPIAPHANIEMNGSALDDGHTLKFGSPVSAERHKHLFKDVKVPRTESFNPDNPSGANWLLGLKQQNKSNVDYNDHFYRQRLRALQAVDELVDGLFERLEAHGIMDNTYIIYSSDNGFHIGQHRLQPGKSCGYEEDINVPLIIRGPGVAKNHTTSMVTTHTDLAPTFFHLLGIPPRDDFDGTAFPVTAAGIEMAKARRREHVNVEYWGFASGEGKYDNEILHENNTYKAIRILGPTYNLFYSIWCTNEHELYDMEATGLPISKVVARLDSLLFVLKSCRGITCQQPWQTLHPHGDVLTLEDALSSRFDRFYEVEQQRVEYNFCSNGYLIEAEGPMWETQGSMFRHGLGWYEWV
ncbi:arylsulfatase [Drepanopeziza brunnea f. sp. 'multigermtubi' MB_m1]|uniref:Arylsulfatase n=1 Tax=Marssonina brunnea f. sp. multigermtubi (strain MB_m1) TaxID=1072389 RepID=K1XHN4_MARBU|nr:arylsulfatase [Drepanopeziza brunnea f. sp. 'multigermtubi' MB_m1]EKD11969.1 arylsulfatase [Drepanopeziza brunnea f. sp. 'multigermtubi' MB_m1]